MKRKANKAERDHMERVAALGCVLSYHLNGVWGTPCEVHHVRVAHGWGRTSHFATIGLTPKYHRDGRYGVHGMGREEFTRMYGISELMLLETVNETLGVIA